MTKVKHHCSGLFQRFNSHQLNLISTIIGSNVSFRGQIVVPRGGLKGHAFSTTRKSDPSSEKLRDQFPGVFTGRRKIVPYNTHAIKERSTF